MPEPAAPDPLYVAARSVLLDGLEALGGQRQAAILVGAHAVYLRVGQSDLATTPHTTDADLVLDPSCGRAGIGVLEPLKPSGQCIPEEVDALVIITGNKGMRPSLLHLSN